MEQMPNMNFQGQSPLSLVEEQNRLKQQALQNGLQRDQQTTDQVAKVTSLASSMVQNMVSAASQRQMKEGLTTLATTTTPQAPVSTFTPFPTTLGQMGQVSNDPSVAAAFPTNLSGTEGYADPASSKDQITTTQPPPINTIDQHKLTLLKLAQHMAPEKFGEALTNQAFPKPVEPDAPKEHPVQAKNVLLDGKPTTLNFQNGAWFDQQMQPIGTGHSIAPIPISAPLAAVRGDALDNTMLQQGSRNLNVALASSGSQLGKNATIATNADSAIKQIDQILTGKVVPNKQVMATLAEESARVLAQSSVSSEGRVNNMMPQTAKAKYASWKEWVTNEPQSTQAQAFIKNLRVEMQRQRDQRSSLVEQGIKQSVPALAVLKKRNSDAWESLLDNNGIDVKAAKRGTYKFKDGYTPILDTGQGQAPAAPSDDMNAFLEP